MTHGEATEATRGETDLAYSSASSEPATPPSDLEGAGAEPQRFVQEDGEGRTTPLTDEEPLGGEKRGVQPSTANQAKEAAEIMQMLGGSFHAPGLHGATTCTEATAAATAASQTCRKRDREEDSCGPKLGMVWAPPAFRASAQPMGWQFGLAPAPWAPNLPQRPAHVQLPPPVQRARASGQRQGHSASVPAGAPPEPEYTICPMCQTDSSTSAADPGECLGGRTTPPEPGAPEAEQGRQRRKRTMSRKRSCLRLGRWWKKYGYRGEPPRRPLRSYLFARADIMFPEGFADPRNAASGPAYCQRCSEVFRDHILRSLSNSANCTMSSPCVDCKRILAHFPDGLQPPKKKSKTAPTRSKPPRPPPAAPPLAPPGTGAPVLLRPTHSTVDVV